MRIIRVLRRALPVAAISAVILGVGVGVASAKPGVSYYSEQNPLHIVTNSSTQDIWGTFKGLIDNPTLGTVMQSNYTIRQRNITNQSDPHDYGAYSVTSWYDNATECYVSSF